MYICVNDKLVIYPHFVVSTWVNFYAVNFSYMFSDRKIGMNLSLKVNFLPRVFNFKFLFILFDIYFH